MDIDNIEEFITIDKRIDSAEEEAGVLLAESIRDRWEFGRLMLAMRKGKQLPKGVLDGLAEATGKSRSELGKRMLFAARYPTEDELGTAIPTFESWTQIKKNLPKPPEQPAAKHTPATPPARSKKSNEIIEMAEEGKTRQQIAEQTGESERTVRRELEIESIAQAAVAETVPIDWSTIPGNQRDKLERAKASIRKELEREFRTRLVAELDQHRAKLDEDWAAYKAKMDAQNQRERAARDEERRTYKRGIEVQRAKGLITPDDYNTIRSCLHPDSRASVTDEKLAAAFRLFNDSRIKILLVKEK